MNTLEVVISRMKARGSSVRFVLVSATVPNIDDVASWIGGPHSDPATVFEFGEEYRPCKLTRFVYPMPKPRGSNDWVFASILDKNLFPILQKHSVDKPILVFCPTRKGCVITAQTLAKAYDAAVKSRGSLPWSQPPQIDHHFHDKALAELAITGIGVHHAGLQFDDRRAIEDLYLRKTLRVIVCTSTLAVGVNLPAHTVVIKGVKIFQNNVNKEYSDLDVMQMLGRAGRPQFDKEGTAIIMCEPELEQKYKALVSGTTQLESSLHLNLDEHLNSEIGLGTITDVESAKEWLRNSFLWQRLQKNPRHYAIGKDENQTWQEKVDDLVMQSITRLKETELVDHEIESNGSLCSTEYGDIMSKVITYGTRTTHLANIIQFYIRQSTMGLILKLRPQVTLREILETLSAADELSDLRIRAGEKGIFDKLRQHDEIRFEMKKIQRTSDKVFLLIQAVLGGISLNTPEYKKGDSQPQLEVFTIFRHISRIASALVEVAVVKKSGAQVKHGLELLKALAEHGVTSFQHLLTESPARLEMLLNRRPPFGQELLISAKDLPQYCLKVTEIQVMPSMDGIRPVEVELAIECSLVANSSTGTTKLKKQKGRNHSMTTVLTVTSDLEFVDYRRIPTKALKETKDFKINASLTKPSQAIMIQISSEMDLLGLEENKDFWDMGLDDTGEEVVPIKDLTKCSTIGMASNIDIPGKSKSSVSILDILDQKQPGPPRKLPNGNFDCRDGLSGLPAPPKKRTAASSQAKSTGENQNPTAKALQELQDRHDHKNTDRAKTQIPKSEKDFVVPSESASRRRPKVPIPDFDVTFSELENGPPSTQLPLDIDENDEDLPDLAELMKRPAARESPSPVSNYSNSDIDALIRDAPIDDFEQELLNPYPGLSPLSYESKNDHRAVAHGSYYRTTVSQPDINDNPLDNSIQMSSRHAFSNQTLRKRKQEPLFLEGSSPISATMPSPTRSENLNERQDASGTDDNFAMDDSLFDFVSEQDPNMGLFPSQKSLQLPSPTKAGPSAPKKQRTSYVQQNTSKGSSMKPIVPVSSSVSLVPSGTPSINAPSQAIDVEDPCEDPGEEDPFAELEAWLKTAET
ncbi:hypothetical protein HWV62_26264 [Athelia sp. TMB]|nr:hypothetical protein HWV62_26264 [Athelia sp. TMB]